MSKRSVIGWFLAVAALGLMVGLVAMVAFSAVLYARSIGTAFVGLFEQTMSGLVNYLMLMTIMEIATAAVVWATRGPILGAAWIASRISAWQGQ